MNTFYHGDCLFVMNHDIEPNSIDLIYLDPPFFTGKTQKGLVNKKFLKDDTQDTLSEDWQPGYMEVNYGDSKNFWGDTEKVNAMRTKSPEWLIHIAQTRPDFASYLFYMMERLEACHKVLNDKGGIYLHCDWRASHYLKMIMDEIFRDDNFRNEIVWCYDKWTNNTKSFQKNHDTILFYTKTGDYLFNPSYKMTERTLKSHHRGYGTNVANGVKQVLVYDENRYDEIAKKYPDYKPVIVKNKGVIECDWWNMPSLNSQAKERVGYPTQKPLALLERIIKTSSNEGNTILDPFCGCGTAIVAAQKLGRQWIGIDISQNAYLVSRGRYHQLTLESTFGQSEPEYVERNLDDVNAIESPKVFEKWVNHYFKAKKPMPDRGVDGITQDGIPIQTKTFVVTSKWLRNLLADAILHKQVKQPCKHAILVSQKGFDDTARQQQFEIQTKEGIKVELLTPAMMLEGDEIR